MADNYVCPANPTITHCSYAAKVNDLMGIDAGTIARLRAEIKRLRAALEFYANPENWESVWDHQFKMMSQEPVYRDKGDTARTALSHTGDA